MLELEGMDLWLMLTILQTIEKRLEYEGKQYYDGAKSPWTGMSLPDRMRITALRKKMETAVAERQQKVAGT